MERFDYDMLKIDRKEAGRRLQRLMAVPRYGYHMQVITDLPYQEVRRSSYVSTAVDGH